MIILRSALLISAFGLCAPALAQEADESALEALDKAAPPKPGLQNEVPGARELREAMRRIALSPSDTGALIDAGNAALMLDDANAALNFFTRANSLQPGSGRIKAGLAAATVRSENPFEALRLFDEAVKLGISERSIAADRAMAFDLLGNFERAQQDYQLARTASTPDELIIQQSISLSLMGRKNDADAMLVPLLKKDSPSAWRARAFMLAARGEIKESSKVAQGFLDAASAQRIERYLRLMPQLTGAQQAAAIHLGHFPANNIGRDSEAVRSVAATIPPVANPIGSGRLIPSGDPLGPRKVELKPVKESKQDKRDREKAEKAATDAAKLASASGVNSSSTKPTGKGGLSTDFARARIEEAQKASMAIMTARDLPVPETARPPVKIILPPLEAPVKVALSTPGIQPATPMPPSQQVLSTKTPDSATQTGAGLTPFPPQIIPAPELKQVAVAEVKTVVGAPMQGPIAKPVIEPGFDALTAQTPISPTQPALTHVSPIPVSPAQELAAQGPMPDGAVIGPSKTQIAFINSAPVQKEASQTVAPTPPPVEAEIKPAPPAAFDLGAFVGAIEIPESEQKPSAVPVDLKKIKPASAKVASVAVDPKAAAKGKAGAKTPPNIPRIWVQIATGQASVFGNTYRGWMKKKPDLFKGREAWTSPWSKSARLLVGPFADLKTAKKWEADFRKAGGAGFVWNSSATDIVDKLKSK